MKSFKLVEPLRQAPVIKIEHKQKYGEEEGVQDTNREGKPLYLVHLLLPGAYGDDVAKVTVPFAETPEIAFGDHCDVHGLTLRMWTSERGAGLSFTADRIEQVGGMYA